MAGGSGSPGTSLLARVLDEQMRRYHEDITQDLKLDFGVIGNDWSLRTNTFPYPIPKGDYSVCKGLSGVSVNTDSAGGHEHAVALPKLGKGDHVLVAWVQKDACVIDVIVSSRTL